MFTKKQYINYIFPPLIIAIVTSITYSQLQGHSYLFWDDYKHVFNNPLYSNIGIHSFIDIFTTFTQVNWHPITSLSFLIDFSLWPKNPIAFKIFNISIHIGNSIIVYFIGLKIYSYINTRRAELLKPRFDLKHIILFSFISSLLFAIHPQHTESVIWITERKDVLCALFYFCAILSYFKQVDYSNSPTCKNITATFFVLALMSKPMAVTLPVTLIFIDIFVINDPYKFKFSRSQIIALASNKIILFVASVAFSILTIFTQRSTIEENVSFGLLSRIVDAAIALIHYISTAISPFRLSPYYPLSEHSTNVDVIGISAILLVLSIILILYWIYKKWTPYPLAVAIYLLITISPVIGLIKVGHAGYADRYMYIPSVSLYLAFGYFLGTLITKPSLKPLHYGGMIGGFLLLGSFTVATFNYTKYWKNDDTLWNRVIDLYPNQTPTPYHNLASIYALRDEIPKSIEYYNKALKLSPKNFNTIHNLAKLYQRMGNREKAAWYYKILADTHPQSPQAYIIYGDYLFSINRLKLAEKNYNKALKYAPNNLMAIYKSAFMDAIDSNYPLAINKLNIILSADNNNKEALRLLASIMLNTGKVSEAKSIANTVLKLEPNDKTARKILKKVAERTAMGNTK